MGARKCPNGHGSAGAELGMAQKDHKIKPEIFYGLSVFDQLLVITGIIGRRIFGINGFCVAASINRSIGAPRPMPLATGLAPCAGT